jgi:hypothetical protein
MWRANKGRGGKKNVMLWCRWDFCFLGEGTCVTKQIKDAWAPFSMGVHCVAHWINLAVQFLSNLTLFAQLEVFMEIYIHIFHIFQSGIWNFRNLLLPWKPSATRYSKMSRHFECPCLIHQGRSWLSTSRCL